MQEDIIQSCLQKKDTLALLPTGGGKSICYQIPALNKEGICIVITPLISLMKDQVDALKNMGVKAYALYSGMSRKEIDITLDNCIYGDAKLLYVSPERLQSEIFQVRASQMNINLLAVDEAHCISQWGYDFRPSYLKITEFREMIPDVPCLAVTATATPEVEKDIIEKLDLHEVNVFNGSFVRKKLSLSVRKTEDKDQKILEILSKVPGSAIIYVNSRKSAKEISVWLNHNNIQSDYYHAGLSHDSRQRKQDEWQINMIRVMVATNAFGMGINKSDVRVVIHYDIPSSPEAFYQEAGRAGRDEKLSYSVVLFQNSDKIIQQQNLERSHPEPDFIKKIYQAMANYLKIAVGSSEMESYDFDIHEFSSNFNFHISDVYNAIQKLKEEGYIDLNESFYHPSKFIFNTDKEKIYEYQVVHEDYDLLIKGLLRFYGGEAFAQFASISERQLAKYLNATTYQIIKKLESLHKNGIIYYDKIKDTPQLTFLTQRLDTSNLRLDTRRLKERKMIAQNKLNSVLEYLESDQCRMKWICGYFGEDLKNECGLCDICLSKKKKVKTDLDSLLQTVKKSISTNPKSEKEIIQENMNIKSEELLTAIKNLLEKGDIYYDQGGKLHVAK